MSVPTRALALEAVRKVMTGDARAKAVLERWMKAYPDVVIQAFHDWIEHTK